MLNRSWLFIALPLAVVAIVLLSLAVASLLRTVRRSVVVSVPVAAEQLITFSEVGSYVLSVEGTSLSRVASGLNFTLVNAGTAASIPLSAVLVRTNVSSFSRTRLALYRFEIPASGGYTLRISGTNPNTDIGNAAIVITRSFTTSLVLHVLALITLGAMFVGSLVVIGLVMAKHPLTIGADGNAPAPASRTAEVAIAQAAAVVHSRTTVDGNAIRLVVLDVLCGAIAPEIAGAGNPGGLLLDLRSLTASGYTPVDGQEGVVLLAQLSVPVAGAAPTMVMGMPLQVLRMNGNKFVYANRDGTLQRELSLAEMRGMCPPASAGSVRQ